MPIRTLVAVILLGGLAAGVLLQFTDILSTKPDAPLGDIDAGAEENPRDDGTGLPDGGNKGDANAAAAAADRALVDRLKELGFPTLLPPSGHAFLLGRVVSAGTEEAPDPTPIGNAGCELWFVAEDDSRADTPDLSGATRPDGRFLLTVPFARKLQLQASAEGFGSAEQSIDPISSQRRLRELGDLTLQAEVGVQVKVTTGVATLQEPVDPVANVKIKVFAEEAETPLFEGETDKDGQVAIPGLAPARYRFVGECPPFALIEEEHSIEREGQEIAFNVQRVGQVKIRAVSEAGAALTQFKVAMDIRRDNYGWMMPYFSDAELEGIDAWHLIEDVKEGAYDLYAVAEGFALSTQSPITVKAGETTEVRVELKPGGRLRGRVVSKITGEPIEGALVTTDTDIIPSSLDVWKAQILAPMARATRTDARGQFDLPDLNPGTHRILASHGKFAANTKRAVDVPAGGKVPEITLELGVGGTLQGHVFGKDGAPIAGREIMAISIMDPMVAKKVPPITKTNEEGFYQFGHLPRGFYMVLNTNPDPAPGEQPTTNKNKSVSDGKVTVVDFGKRGSGASVSGRVTWSDGRPGTGLLVMLMDATPTGGIPDFQQSVTNANGEYELDSVEQGDYAVMIAAEGRGGDFTRQGELKVGDTSRIVHDIELQGGALRGRLVAAETGNPVTGEVALLTQNGQGFVGRLDTNSSGRFEWPVVAPGSYILAASADGYAPHTLEAPVVVSDGEATVIPDIRLEAGGIIVGRILDAAGRPVEGARVLLRDQATGRSAPTWSLNSDGDGRFEIRSVPVGRYQVTGVKEAARWASDPLEVTAGATLEVTLNPEG